MAVPFSSQTPHKAHTAIKAPRGDLALIVAWLLSVAVHVIVFTVMFAIPWIDEAMGTSDPPAVSEVELRDAPKQVKVTMAPIERPFQSRQQVQTPPTHIAPAEPTALTELTKAATQEPSFVGIGTAGGESSKPGLSIVGIGTGGGEFSKYGLRIGSAGPGPQFFGLGGQARAARRITYVVDRSGSMIGVFSDLQKELKSSIDRLRKSQKYHVIFYSTDPPTESPPGRLVNAIRASKERTFEFIDQTVAEGMTQPIEAMRRAFQLKPDLIYFLSDGDIPEAEELKENLRNWNRDEKVRIFCIAFVSSAGRQLLEDIAREHNGAFRFVSEYDLED